MNRHNYKRINEELFHEVLDNGLNVYLLPKTGFHKSYATLSTNLGSIDTQITNKSNETIDLPYGIAHFLEHKLFEKDNEDVSTLFAKNQARVNAYTQNNRTTYLFSCTDNLLENISLLFDFVQNPAFTTKGVNKEKGIIAQEIKMYDDDPNTVAYMSLIRNLFKDHPIKHDILGTIQSINEIDVNILKKAHNTFYSPTNMVLFVTGNFDVEELITYIRKNQKEVYFNEDYFSLNNLTQQDDLAVVKEKTLSLEIGIPNFLMGVKQLPTNLTKENIIKKELIMAILIDLVIGKSSSNYKHLINNGLINDTFGIDITFEESYGFFLIGSETNFPVKLEKELKHILLNLYDYKITLSDFSRTKKQIIGGFIQALNNLEYIANQFTKYYYVGASLFDILDIADSITIDDILSSKEYLSKEDSYSSITVFPKEK